MYNISLREKYQKIWGGGRSLVNPSPENAFIACGEAVQMKRTILELQPDEKKLLGDLPDGTQVDLCMKQPLAAAMWSRQYVLQNFHRAMEEGWIQVYFQPVIRSVTGMMCGAEALCRWIDPDRGMITPDQFIPVLEEQGLIYTLDLYVVEQVCRGYRDLVKRNVPLIPVSVNLSRVDFRHPDLVERIDALARQYQVPPGNSEY